MPLTLDTSPSPRPCSQCSLTFSSSRALRRHVALDHTPDPTTADLLAALESASSRPSDVEEPVGRPARGSAGLTAPVRDPAPQAPKSDAAHPASTVSAQVWARIAVAAYAFTVLFAVSPLLGAALLVTLGVVATHLMGARTRAALARSLREDPDERPGDPPGGRA